MNKSFLALPENGATLGLVGIRWPAFIPHFSPHHSNHNYSHVSARNICDKAGRADHNQPFKAPPIFLLSST